MPQFVHNKDTGEIGYWTGSEVIALPRSMSSDPAGAQQLVDMLKQSKQPPQFQNIQPAEQQVIAKLHAAVQPAPAEAPARPGRGLLDAFTLSGAEKELAGERERQKGKSKLQVAGELALDVLSSLPAAAGGKAVASGLKLLSREGPRSFMGRAGERVATGVGSALGELAGQKAGVLPENETSPFVAGAMGAAVGPGRAPRPAELTSGEKSARRTAAAEPIIEAGQREGALAVPRLREGLTSPDIDTTRIIGPIERVILDERALRPIPKSGGQTSGGNVRDNIVNELERISRNMGTIFMRQRQPGVPLPQGAPAQATGAPQIQTPKRAQIPPTAASEAAAPTVGPGMAPRQTPTPSAYGTPATQANQPQTPAPGRTVIRPMPVMNTAEDVIKNVQAMRRLRDDAYRAGQGDLANSIETALTRVRAAIPGYPEYARLYSRSKGFEEAGNLIRRSSDSPNAVRKLLEGSRKTAFTSGEQRRIIRAAERGIGIDWALSQMLKHPVGQKFVALGVSPKGELKNAILMVGAQAMGRSGEAIMQALQEGEGEE